MTKDIFNMIHEIDNRLTLAINGLDRRIETISKAKEELTERYGRGYVEGSLDSMYQIKKELIKYKEMYYDGKKSNNKRS